MEMRLLAEKPLSKKLQAERERHLFLIPPSWYWQHRLPWKARTAPRLPFQKHFFHPVMPLLTGIWGHQGPDGEDQHSVLALATGSLWVSVWATAPGSISSLLIGPKYSKHSFYVPSSWPWLLPRPLPRKPTLPSPLCRSSMAEGLIQTLPFQESPPLPSNDTSCLYQSPGGVEVLLCSCSVCVCFICFYVSVIYCHSNTD